MPPITTFPTPPEPGSVYWCDALTLIRAMPDASVDAVITDFPYNTTALEWENDIALSDVLSSELWRILKANAPLITTASQPFTSLLVAKWLSKFRHELIWQKTRPTGYLNANRAPMKTHENILVFSKSGVNYYPQMTPGKPYRATSGAVGGYVHDKTVGGYVTDNDGWRYPKSVLQFASCDGEHPTQKPVPLYEYLTITYTAPGDLIVDPFCGSGTTLLAARNLNRRFIGCDITPEYVDIARRRLAQPFTLNMFEQPAP